MNNNPFESGNSNKGNPFEAGKGKKTKYNSKPVNPVPSSYQPVASETNKNQEKMSERVKKKKKRQEINNTFSGKKKSKFKRKLLIVLAIVIFFNLSNISYFLNYELPEFWTLHSAEAEENYKFDSADIKTYDPAVQNALNLEPGTGKDYSKQLTKEDLVYKSSDERYEYEEQYIVGEDIEPGVYTVNVGSDIYIDIEGLDIFLTDNEYVNIPLAKGESIEFTSRLYNEDDYNEWEDANFKIEMTKQDELINYDGSQYGLFIYGKSNFEPEIKTSKNSSTQYEYYLPSESRGATKSYISYDRATIKGVPGSYFFYEY